METVYPQPLKEPNERHKDIEDVDVHHLVEWSLIGNPQDRCISDQSLGNGQTLKLSSVYNVKNAFFDYGQNVSSLLRAVSQEQYIRHRKIVK